MGKIILNEHDPELISLVASTKPARGRRTRLRLGRVRPLPSVQRVVIDTDPPSMDEEGILIPTQSPGASAGSMVE